MTLQTFPVEGNPRVVITQLDGSLSIQAWKEPAISGEMEGPVAEMQQEGDTLLITGCKSNLELRVPAIVHNGVPIVTDIYVTRLSGSVTIVGGGRVKLKEIGGDVTLRNIVGDMELENVHGVAGLTSIGGDVHAVSMTALRGRGIRGDVSLSDIAQVEIDVIGGSLALHRVGTAEIISVNGDLEAAGIVGTLSCVTVSGDCWVQDSTRAQVCISNVAGNLQMEGMVDGRMSNIGGNLDLQAIFPAGSNTRFHVDGDASVTLPGDASLNLYIIVGGEVSGEASDSGGGGSFINLVYGDGAATLNLLIAGDLKLLGSCTPRRLR